MENDPEKSNYPIIHDAAATQFYIDLGVARAVLEYELQGGTMIINHTGVPTAWEGQGLASRLAHAALDYAREQSYKVVPLCSYIAGYIRKHPEYHALVD